MPTTESVYHDALLSPSLSPSPQKLDDRRLNWNSCHTTALSVSLAHMGLNLDTNHTTGDVTSSVSGYLEARMLGEREKGRRRQPPDRNMLRVSGIIELTAA